MNITKAECTERQEKVAKEARDEKQQMFTNLKTYMENAIDKIDEKFDKNEERQDAKFEKVFNKIDAFAKTKMDKDIFIWITGVLITILLLFGGILLSQCLDLNTISTALQLDEITHE